MNKLIAVRMFVNKDNVSKLKVYNNNGKTYCIDNENKVHNLKSFSNYKDTENALRELTIKSNLREIGTKVIDSSILKKGIYEDFDMSEYITKISRSWYIKKFK